MKQKKGGMRHIRKAIALFCLTLFFISLSVVSTWALEAMPYDDYHIDGSWCGGDIGEKPCGYSGSYKCTSPFPELYQPTDGSPIYTRGQTLWGGSGSSSGIALYKMAFYEPSFSQNEMIAFGDNDSLLSEAITKKMEGYVHKFASESDGRNTYPEGTLLDFSLEISADSIKEIPTEIGNYTFLVYISVSDGIGNNLSFPTLIWSFNVTESKEKPDPNPPIIDPEPPIVDQNPNPNPNPNPTPPSNVGNGNVTTSRPRVPLSNIQSRSNNASISGDDLTDNAIDTNTNNLASSDKISPQNNQPNKSPSKGALINNSSLNNAGLNLTPLSTALFGASAIWVAILIAAIFPDIAVLRWYKEKKGLRLWK